MDTTGAFINAGAIVAGVLAALGPYSKPSAARDRFWAQLVAGLCFYLSARVVWDSLPWAGGPKAIARQMGVAFTALILGNVTGRLLSLQSRLNELGRNARIHIETAARQPPGTAQSPTRVEGISATAISFTLAPTAIIGSIADGMTHEWRLLAAKGAFDFAGAFGLASLFRWNVLPAALAVFAWEALWTLGTRTAWHHINDRHLADALITVAGLIFLGPTLVVLRLRTIPFADYLPALVWAPLLAAWWR